MVPKDSVIYQRGGYIQEGNEREAGVRGQLRSAGWPCLRILFVSNFLGLHLCDPKSCWSSLDLHDTNTRTFASAFVNFDLCNAWPSTFVTPDPWALPQHILCTGILSSPQCWYKSCQSDWNSVLCRHAVLMNTAQDNVYLFLLSPDNFHLGRN